MKITADTNKKTDQKTKQLVEGYMNNIRLRMQPKANVHLRLNTGSSTAVLGTWTTGK